MVGDDDPNPVRLELPDSIDLPVVSIDRHRISQVLDNLLNNSVKYSPGAEEILFNL